MEDFIQQMIDSYSAAQQQTVFLPVIIAIIAGLLICFFGYRFIRLWCAIIGFAAGALIAAVIAAAMGADVVLIPAIAVGLITAALSFAFYKAGVFVIGFGAALNVANGLMSAYGIEIQWWMIIIALAVAVGIGMLAVRLVKPVIIVCTSLSGAVSVVINILGLFHVTNWVVIFVVSGILAVAGMAYQIIGHGKKKKSDNTDRYDIQDTEEEPLPIEETESEPDDLKSIDSTVTPTEEEEETIH